MKRASDVKKCSALGDVKNASPQGQEKKRAALTKIAAAIFVAAFGAQKIGREFKKCSLSKNRRFFGEVLSKKKT